MAMCFDDTDPENPSVKNVYEKIKPFLIPSIVVVVDWFLREENDEYDITANKLIESLRHVKDPESFQYSNGEIDYNIYEYYKQLALKTEVGMEFVKDYETGLKFLQT